MEKLNGIAEWKFELWLWDKYPDMLFSQRMGYTDIYIEKNIPELLPLFPDSIKNALIIEFFDYWGYYIFNCDTFQFGYKIMIDGDDEPRKENHGFENRNDANNEAIQKLVEIYNEHQKD